MRLDSFLSLSQESGEEGTAAAQTDPRRHVYTTAGNFQYPEGGRKGKTCHVYLCFIFACSQDMEQGEKRPKMAYRLILFSLPHVIIIVVAFLQIPCAIHTSVPPLFFFLHWGHGLFFCWVYVFVHSEIFVFLRGRIVTGRRLMSSKHDEWRGWFTVIDKDLYIYLLL